MPQPVLKTNEEYVRNIVKETADESAKKTADTIYEKIKTEHFEKLKIEQDKFKIEQDKVEKLKIEQDKIKIEQDKVEKEKLEKEKIEIEKLEKEKLEKTKLEKTKVSVADMVKGANMTGVENKTDEHKYNDISCPTCKGHVHKLEGAGVGKVKCTGDKCGIEYALIPTIADYKCDTCGSPKKKPIESNSSDICPFCNNNKFHKYDWSKIRKNV